MENETTERRCGRSVSCGGAANGVYGLAFVGAAIYFIQHATSFWNGALGLLKALLWPAVLIYKALELLKM